MRLKPPAALVALPQTSPWAATEEEVGSLASQFGLVTRLVLPPTKGLALLAFADPPAAARHSTWPACPSRAPVAPVAR